jgi:glycosyltransferase involved in cell wall biosynthesis
MDPSTLAGNPNPSDADREGRQAEANPAEQQPDTNGLAPGEAEDAGASARPAAAGSRARSRRADRGRAPQPAPSAPTPLPREPALLPVKYGLVELPPAAAGKRPTIALFCYEDPSTPVGQYVGKLVQTLARRNNPVHLFSRAPFDLDLPGVTVTAVGGGPEDDLLGSVEEYTRRACAAYATQYPGKSAQAVLLGQEWSTFPALTRLREQTGQEVHLSLQSLERQRSDLRCDVSRRIDEIETAALRQARTVLIQEQATGEVARHWVPECGPRLRVARQPFPTHKFNPKLDPGQIKVRYQIGPIDPTVLFIGNLDDRHGPDILMKSVPAVLKNHPQARFAFVGDGPLLWPLRVYARYLHLEGVVRLVGHLDGQDLYDLIQACDVLAVPSRVQTEWWPFQAAWAAGKPVVATHPMAGTVLEHNKDCLLVYPHESSVVWGIERVLYDGELRTRLGQNGTAKLDQRFGFNGVAEQLEESLGIKQPV